MSSQTISPACRATIYYWKCDRPAAFHGTSEKRDSARYLDALRNALIDQLQRDDVSVRPGSGQGNHLTFIATVGGTETFVRLEDGPERDDNLEVESHILGEVRAIGLLAPRVVAVDALRTRTPFAYQVLEKIEAPDLNQLLKKGTLDLPVVAEAIGAAVARWQDITPPGFGPFHPDRVREGAGLQGFHSDYAAYFHLHLDRHLALLVDQDFLSRQASDSIRDAILRHRHLLDLEQGCLVHKDLALWNVLGTEREIMAYIDWDDAISGDPMDDLSLLGCFYDGPVLGRALRGYESVRPLPADARQRFWLHLLRNMIVKAVIRVGAGYFKRDSGFFLVDAGQSGGDLRTFTLNRLRDALEGLQSDAPITSL